jgi:hypothetical protein
MNMRSQEANRELVRVIRYMDFCHSEFISESRIFNAYKYL